MTTCACAWLRHVLAIVMAFKPYDPTDEVRVHRGKLPHWRQWGVTYFITSRLADSVPVELAKNWKLQRDAWLHDHNISTLADVESLNEKLRKEYHQLFTAEFHKLLDAGHGECLLGIDRCAELLIDRLLAGHAKSYHLDSWCIMPNHMHVLVEPLGKCTLGEIVRHWKGGSANDINRHLKRKGMLWQAETYDHIVRNEPQLTHYRKYIAENPDPAHLKTGFVLGCGGLAHASKAAVVQGCPSNRPRESDA
jgi:putative transposase